MAESDRNGSVCRNCCQSFMTMLFSTIGLIILIVTYTVIGGFLFQLLEASAEERRIAEGRKAAALIRKNYSDLLWEVTFSLNILQKGNWTEEVQDVLKQFEESVYNVTKYEYWDGKTADNAKIEPHWSFAGSMLYSLTAITTIGYGHVAPKTQEGQLLTILYCIIGLPLTLMCIAKLGKAFAYVFRVIYYTCCCAICCLCCIASRHKRASRSRRGSDVLTSHLAALVVGRTASSSLKLNESKQKENALGQVWCREIKTQYNKGLNHDNAVPTSLCLLVMAAYIAGGGVLFAKWEPEWNVQEGAYFCFITLTTIGFGDYVPGVDKLGADSNKSVRNQNLVLCALYVFIGLAFIGMCIDLMQVDVINKVKWIGKVLGISETKKRKTHSDQKKARVGKKLSTSDPPPAMSQSITSNSLAEKLPRNTSYHNLGIPTMSECNGLNGSMHVAPYLVSINENQKLNNSTSEPCTPLLPDISPKSPSNSFLSSPPTYNSCNTDRQSDRQSDRHSESDGSYRILRNSCSDDLIEEQQVETVIG